jgi:hypothetical protein
MTGATLVVAADHGPALRHLGVPRHRFVTDVLALFRPIVHDVCSHRPSPAGAVTEAAAPDLIPARVAAPAA